MRAHVTPCSVVCVCVCVCAGQLVGGVWGLGEGIQRGAGLSTRLRATAIVNGMTRRGPFLANNLAVLGQPPLAISNSHCVTAPVEKVIRQNSQPVSIVNV